MSSFKIQPLLLFFFNQRHFICSCVRLHLCSYFPNADESCTGALLVESYFFSHYIFLATLIFRLLLSSTTVATTDNSSTMFPTMSNVPACMAPQELSSKFYSF